MAYENEWLPGGVVQLSLKAQSQSMTGMLLKAQNAIGELSLEIGTTRKGIQYFQKAWPNLMDFLPSNLEDDQDLVKQEDVKRSKQLNIINK
ncbi:putative tetratricopeptide repeat protein 41 [Manis javanica]|nr:putative tetratricopeptide repeat protein 41 [Manis javanica]